MYHSEIIDVHDADSNRASLDVTVSIGEFDPGQTIVEFRAAAEYAMICLDEKGALELIQALSHALEIHAGRIREVSYAAE